MGEVLGAYCALIDMPKSRATRIINVLEKHGVRTIDELWAFVGEDGWWALHRLPGLGKKSTDTILTILGLAYPQRNWREGWD